MAFTPLHPSRRRVAERGFLDMLPVWVPWALCAFLGTLTLHSYVYLPATGPALNAVESRFMPDKASTLVSYAYYEKDEIQRANFEFFLLTAIGAGSIRGQDEMCDYVVVLNGEACTPCKALEPLLSYQQTTVEGITWVKTAPGITLIKRSENEGMDFAAHNTTMAYLSSLTPNRLWAYKFYMFLNSSVKGPFVPKYYPFHWSVPYTSKLTDTVKVVSSSIVCLPEVDAGGFGPKVESWAFATDAEGLRVLVEHGVFLIRYEKLTSTGVVVMGEYGITIALNSHGYTIDTLMAKYDDVDWADPANWMCNDNVHPSRHGTYDGISMHPYEVVFLKASWHVGIPFADKYASWLIRQHRGQSNAEGVFDHEMYRYAITPTAQDKHPFIERAYAVGPNVERFGLTHFRRLMASSELQSNGTRR